MAADMFLNIDGLKGESTDAAHKDWIEIQSFSHNVVAPSGAAGQNSAGGGTAGRTKHQDFAVTKEVDATSPALYEMCSSGKHISKITVDLMRSSGDSRVKYMSIEMDEVVVSSVAASGNAGSGQASELITFDYGKIVWTYTQQEAADGSKGGNATGGWDLAANKAAA